ncbi:hypothetical protein BHM03_00037042 [Ensete ventricosum]|nr:hypothetical protein BHM03_00037042 [Ensete ventricosum]
MYGTIFVCGASPLCFVSGLPHPRPQFHCTKTCMYSQWDYFLVMEVSEANTASGKQANDAGRLLKSAETPRNHCLQVIARDAAAFGEKDSFLR